MSDAPPPDSGSPSPSDALPGEPTSPWLDDRAADVPTWDPLTDHVRVDVAVVGGGIAGLTTAIECRERGHSVAVLERDRLVSGTTGRTTAKVTSQHGLVYDRLRRSFGDERARQYARVNEAAIDRIEERVEAWGVREDCGFERRPHYVYGDDRDAVEREVDAARAAGAPASFVASVPPFDRATCGVRFDDQACFHPRRYLLALAEALDERSGTAIYERTRVTDVDPGRSPRLRTEGDRSAGHQSPAGRVDADRVVLATGFPLLDRAGYFARLHPKRSSVLGIRVDGDLPEGMYYRPAGAGGDTYRSVRPHRDPDHRLLLIGGENHKTGQGGSTADRYRRLARWARERFVVDEIAYRWATQDYASVDGVPLVGRLGPGARNVSVATGFGGWGMTGATAAGRLLAQLIDGESPPEAGLFDPLRFTPVASAGEALTENADAVSQLATDWARTLFSSDSGHVDQGSGHVVRRDGRPVAVSRDDAGRRSEVSAVCPHMGCLVDWNDAEGTWDCPCHGSRFDADGTLIEGPATEGLSSVGSEADRGGGRADDGDSGIDPPSEESG